MRYLLFQCLFDRLQFCHINKSQYIGGTQHSEKTKPGLGPFEKAWNYFFPRKFGQKSGCGLYTSAAYTSSNTVLTFWRTSRPLIPLLIFPFKFTTVGVQLHRFWRTKLSWVCSSHREMKLTKVLPWPVGRDRRILPMLRTNQIAGFVTVPSWKKIIYFIFIRLNNQLHELFSRFPQIPDSKAKAFTFSWNPCDSYSLPSGCTDVAVSPHLYLKVTISGSYSF